MTLYRNPKRMEKKDVKAVSRLLLYFICRRLQNGEVFRISCHRKEQIHGITSFPFTERCSGAWTLDSVVRKSQQTIIVFATVRACMPRLREMPFSFFLYAPEMVSWDHAWKTCRLPTCHPLNRITLRTETGLRPS